MRQKKRRPGKGPTRMPRTTVSFPPDVQVRLERVARQKKVYVAWVVRDAVDRYFEADTPLFRSVVTETP